MRTLLLPQQPVETEWPTLRVHECFESLADRQPLAPAILSDRGVVTYAELERKANSLAHALLAREAEREEAVGVLTERSESLPQAFLGILKAGGVYLPMGADLPAQRLASMAAQSGMRLLIALDGQEPPTELLDALATNAEGRVRAVIRPEEIALDRDDQRPVLGGKPTDLVAILFTSGSTGRPKGVLIQHDACVNMGYGHISSQGIVAEDRLLLAAAPGFIMGFRELCLPLMAGAAYVPASRKLLDDPAELLGAMSRHRVTVAMFTPSYLHLLHGDAPEGLRCLLTAGERPIADDARTYARKLDYWNIQGATEVCGTICMLRVNPDGAGPLTSGRPFANTGVHLLDGEGREVPSGEVGEICVTGVGVARGYLNQPDATAERFVETAHGRAFRSNDLGRWNEDGELESLGRVNDVVKVSGQSVSLGEVEQTLLRHDSVRSAAAMQHEGKLIAFVESDRPRVTPLAEWHRFLARTLPSFMMPAKVMALPKMPINSFGKVDRQALVALAAQAAQSRPEPDQDAAPQGELECQIAQVWEEVLEVRPVLREDNFFALGGTSLLSIAIAQRLHALGYAVSAQTVLTAPTVAALAERIASTSATGEKAVLRASNLREDEATAGQKDFWIAAKLGLASIGSQVTRVLAVEGMVPAPERFRSAWTQLVARHAALRTAFFAGGSDAVHWRTAEPEELQAGLSLSIDSCATVEDARKVIAGRLEAPFNLTEAPLARAGLTKVSEGDGETLFWFALHHSVADGLSARIVQEEMLALLLDRTLAPAPHGVALASQAEREYLASELAERDRVYWQDKLGTLAADAGGEAFHELAVDQRRPANPSGKSAENLFDRLDAATVAELGRLAQRLEAGLHALLLTLLGAEARRRSGRKNLVVGSGISVRPPGTDAAVGYFVNLLPLVLTEGNTSSLAEQIRATQTALTDAIDHGSYPAGMIYREFRQRHPDARPYSRSSLFDIEMTANPSGSCGDARAGLSMRPRHWPRELADPPVGVDLDFSHEPVEDGLELALAWNPDVYRRETAQAWLSSFAAWARWVAEDIGRADAPLPALLPEEARRLALWERGPERERPANRFHEIFESLTDSDPRRPAVVTEKGVQSYAELEHRANQIANVLLDHGVAHEEPVAVLTECSADLPATVLGIWKAGAVYVPLGLDQPAERLVHIVRDSGAGKLIVLDGHQTPPSLAREVRTILRPEECGGNGERSAVRGAPTDLACIIYTSGTTGMPKGVLVQHDSLINAVYMTSEAAGLTAEDRTSLVASPGFDASLWELGNGLLLGGAIVPISRALRDDPWEMKRHYTRLGVTVAFHAPSYLRVSKETPFEGLRVLLSGGEAPTHDDAQWHTGPLTFWNVYGPTEAAIYISGEPVPPHPDPNRPLSVGRPMANTRISIRRDNGEPVPPGVVGEVWLSGKGLARGYLNNPDLTAERFIDTPEGRFYRSGDLGRWTEDGRLELHGRIDQQIKFHGQRLELGEIEQALITLPGVKEAFALMEAGTNDTKVLRAFVRLIPNAAMPAEGEWRGHLGERLPAYMVPASITSVAVMPLTSAGKIDRDALLLIPRNREEGVPKNPPSGEMETRIAALWEELLGESVSREDNFFALGGNSLLAVTLAHRLSRELNRPVPAREMFASPTLAGFARKMTELVRTAGSGGEARNAATTRSDLATEGQREFWVSEAAGLDTRAFTIPMVRLVEGEMPSLDRWNKAWTALVTRHESLRTWFHEDAEGRLRRATVPVLMTTLETTTRPDRASARAFIRERQGQPFLMGALPLWRAGLVTVADSGEHLFWLALHHSLGDGRSLGILTDELGALLRGERLPILTGNFAESAAREEAYLASPACPKDELHWRELLARQPDAAFEEGPLDFPRSATAKPGNHRFETRLEAAVAEGLKALARRHNASLHAVIVTLLALETRRRTRRNDVIIGTTASARETAADEQVVGYYVNMLPLPCHLPQAVSFGAALHETQQALADGLQHLQYPFARIYHSFWKERPEHHNPSRYPLFDLAVTESPETRLAADSPRLARISASSGRSAGTVAYELTDASPGQDMVLIHECLADGRLLLQWQVNAAVYSQETGRAWFDALLGWAEWLIEDEEQANEPLPFLLPSEALLLESWENGAIVDRSPLRAHELFERILDNQSDQCDGAAIVTESSTTTYGELEREANVIAHSLLQRGAGHGTVVGVLTERSASLPAAILGIWKAGATYLPLAADLPQERLAFMARDAGAELLIALDGLAVPRTLLHDLPPPFRPEEMDAEFRRSHSHRPLPVRGGDVAYIIYTSGSTGQPKGTLIGHDAYVNMLLGAGETLGLNPDDRCLMFSSPSFDVSLSDMGLPLAFGAAMCPVPQEVLDSPSRFRSFLSGLNVTVADITPTYLRLLDGAELASLRILVTGGEAPLAEDVRIYASRHVYFNAYGPTENTISSVMGRLAPDGQGNPCCGRPLPNTSVHICDAEGNPVPPGVVGEVWLGGAGLARGYIGRSELTASAFRDTAKGRRYRSGDLGRWRATGELEILGRIDDQVKLNGNRIELGEIEAALGAHPAVSQAVALLDDGAGTNKSLWAFVRLVPGREAPAGEAWRGYLADRLPASMIPSAVIEVPVIPLTSSGKVDRAALKMRLDGHFPRGGEAPPHDGLEAEIAQVWGELLGRETIHRGDNFFELGGHSLLAIAVAHRLEKSLGYPIPARELFVEPTLEGFARRIGQLSNAAIPAPVFSDRATEGQREFWIAERAGLDTRGFNIALTLTARGRIPSNAEWREAWAALAKRHAALRAGFHEDRDGVLRRFVHPGLRADFEISTWPEMPDAMAHIRERQGEAFAMESPPLWRAGLAHGTGEIWPIFWLALHHSVADGVSLGVLKEELSTLLQGGELPPVPGHFDQSAGREESYLASSASEEDAAYWRGILEGLGDGSPETSQPFDEWQLDFPRPFVRAAWSAKGVHGFGIRLDAGTAAGLRDLARKNGASLHTLMLTLLAHEVGRRTGRPEFLLGTAASTRDSVQESRIVGYYVNMLPVPCRIRGHESFEEALRAMQRNLAGGLQHVRYPFACIYRDFRESHPVAVHPARYPLFDFAVAENPEVPADESKDLDEFHFRGSSSLTGENVKYELYASGPAQDMVLMHEGQEDGSLVLRWFVNAAIYEKETAESWIDSLAGWARFLAEDKRPRGSSLPALLPEEESMLAAWEHGPALPHRAPSFTAIFEQWARVEPEFPALITDRGAQSYATLDARSNALAHALLELGLERGDAVGVLTGRSIGLPETALSIWKAGGCFVPLASDLPADRLAFIVRDAGIRVLVVLDRNKLPSLLAKIGLKVLHPEDLSVAFVSSHREPVEIAGGVVRGSDHAYIIYTSGSTGAPKAVLLLHQGLINFGVGIVAALGIRSDDRALLMASPAFDAWLSDLVMAWTAGAAVVPILRGEMDDIAGVRQKMSRLGVTFATMTPSYLRLFERADFPNLRLLMTMGEAPTRADALHYAARLRYINGYGPTENTIAASYGHVEAHSRRITVGKPLANTSICIRNNQGEPVPPGATGIIWLGGMGLAAGYLNRPDLTAASFVETARGRLYCTGDMGRWTATGDLEILGRADRQVKLRGNRVELAEIEHRLEAHAGVRQAVAVTETHSDGSQTLWVTVCIHPEALEPTQEEWRNDLSATLPPYMLPSAVLTVPAIPMNIAGKVDREALLQMISEERGSTLRTNRDEMDRTSPREGVERQIAQVWAEHLEGQSISREDNFFDLGGNSLRAIAVVNQVRRAFDCAINDLYEHPVLADFAVHCHPRPEHLRAVIQSATRHWRDYKNGLAAYEAERDTIMAAALRDYEAQNLTYLHRVAGGRRSYARVLLTGATGYLGSYLLRELLQDPDRQVSALVRGADDHGARARLGEVLCYYFGPAIGAELLDNPRLTVLAGDLRRDYFGLSPSAYGRLADGLQAVFHSAANVKHFGHYREFNADNVAATKRLLNLAANRAADPADFHLVSTLSVCGKAPETSFRLFTEYDGVPAALDENYYIRSKQEAERMVVGARGELANACIHRVGSLLYAAAGGPLQWKITENAFFRQLAAFLRLGAVPDDAHLWLCHVDVVAQGIVLLAEAADLTNEIHHLENARRDTLASFVTAAEDVRACAFDAFLARLEEAVDEPGMSDALTETLENFGLYRGVVPQPTARRMEIVSFRTQILLARLGLTWPELPMAGQAELLRQAAQLFPRPFSDVGCNSLLA